MLGGEEECDDGDPDPGDGCDENCAVEECWTCDGTCTQLADDTPCDDGDICTVADVCGSGICTGTPILIQAACDWVIVAGDPTRRVQAHTRGHSEINGDICGERIKIGQTSTNNGSVVGADTSNSRTIKIGTGGTTILGDVATGGGGIRATPGSAKLPGLDQNEVAPGDTAVGSGGLYDATGTHLLVPECNAAQDGIDTAAAALDALTSTVSLGAVQIKTNGSGANSPFTIAPGSPAGVTAGAVNVIDMDGLRSTVGGELILDGGADPATVYVLRIDGKISMTARSKITATNGLTPENVVIYNSSRKPCNFGIRVQGVGTVICPDGKLKLNGGDADDEEVSDEGKAIWDGAFLSGRSKVFLGEKTRLTHYPPLGLF